MSKPEIQRIAAFSDGEIGGNPAGVVIADAHPPEAEMRRIAAGWPHGGAIDVVQGEDMGSRSRLRAEIPDERGSSIRVSGTARHLI